MPSTLNHPPSTIPQLPRQRDLRIQADYSAPLMSMETARGVLGYSLNVIQDLLEDQRLAWHWDIGNGGYRAEKRILSRCVTGFQTTSKDCGLAGRSVEDVIHKMILGRFHKPFLTNGELQYILQCERELVLDLIRAGAFQLLAGTDIKRGKGCFTTVTKASVVEFFKERRL